VSGAALRIAYGFDPFLFAADVERGQQFYEDLHIDHDEIVAKPWYRGSGGRG
jgi:hypothetical protein